MAVLWIVDMSRAVIEHPRWIPEEARARLDVRAGENQGRIYRLLPKDRGPRPVPNLSKMSAAELAKRFARRMGSSAIWLSSFWHGATTARSCRTYQNWPVSDSAPPPRNARCWLLARWQRLPVGMLQAAIASIEPRIRRQAVRILAVNHNDFADGAVAARGAPRRKRSDRRFGSGRGPAANFRRRSLSVVARLYSKHVADPYLKFATLRAVSREDWSAFVTARLSDGSLPAASQEPLLSASLASADGAVLPHAIAAHLASRSRRLSAVSAARRANRCRLIAQPAEGQRMARFRASSAVDSHHRHSAALVRRRSKRLTEREFKPPACWHWSQTTARPTWTCSPRACRPTPPCLAIALIAALNRQPRCSHTALFIDRWTSLGPAAKTDILDRLLAHPNRPNRCSLPSPTTASPVAGSTPPAGSHFLQHPIAEIRSLAVKALPSTGSASRDRDDRQTPERIALAGDVQHGRDVYRKRWKVCRMLDGKGRRCRSRFGQMARTVPSWPFITSLLDPNQAVDQRLRRLHGADHRRTFAPRLASAESESSITLKGRRGQTHDSAP